MHTSGGERMDNVPKLDIYACIPHGEAHIIGDLGGLTALRDSINDALESAEGADRTPVFASDGSRYILQVRLLE